MPSSPADFSGVVAFSMRRYPCSPSFDRARDERGIAIALPEIVRRRGRKPPVVPLCVALRLGSDEVEDRHFVFRGVTLVAVSAADGTPWATRLGFPGTILSELEGASSGSSQPRARAPSVGEYHYAVDLVETLALPHDDARYFVHALYAGYGSRVATLTIG